jgi:transposase
MRRLDILVRRGPKANGFTTYAWSGALVVELTEREFGVQFKAANVRRILRKMGQTLVESFGKCRGGTPTSIAYAGQRCV